MKIGLKISSHIKIFLILCFILGLSSNSLAQEPATKTIPRSTFIAITTDKLLKSIPAPWCAEGGLLNKCYKVESETCQKDLLKHLNTCSLQVKPENVYPDSTIVCNSKEECQRKGKLIGSILGQQIGGCAGTHYGQQHCKAFKRKDPVCIEFMRSVGMDPDTFANDCKT